MRALDPELAGVELEVGVADVPAAGDAAGLALLGSRTSISSRRSPAAMRSASFCVVILSRVPDLVAERQRLERRVPPTCRPRLDGAQVIVRRSFSRSSSPMW
ncbi:MAG: hypothetical protein R3F30_13760 [Planctomycetota bacterium]